MKHKSKKNLITYFDSVASKRDAWIDKNKFYHNQIFKVVSEVVPPNETVLEIGCATGNLLHRLNPYRGVGIDFSPEMIREAKKKFPELHFICADAENVEIAEQFDFIVISDVIGTLFDVGAVFRKIQKACHTHTKIIVTQYNFSWQIPLRLAEILKLKMHSQQCNWFATADIENLLYLSNFKVVDKGSRLPLPVSTIPFFPMINARLQQTAFFKTKGVFVYLVAEPIPLMAPRKASCSVIVPCRNEAGNIENCINRMPDFTDSIEIVFVDGGSSDGTVEKIQQMQKIHKNKKHIKLLHQLPGQNDSDPNKMLKAGKGEAVRMGFDAACGDILMILDGDLTVAPEDLPKFYSALVENKADFVNGSRMVYPQQDRAMNFSNYLANKFFSLVFSWLLGQRVTDTLCGTKALFKTDYHRIEDNRAYFGDFDPFGDFDLLFGSARLGLKIVEIPVRYYARIYGNVKIERLKHGLILLRMSWVGMTKLKLFKIRDRLLQ